MTQNDNFTTPTQSNPAPDTAAAVPPRAFAPMPASTLGPAPAAAPAAGMNEQQLIAALQKLLGGSAGFTPNPGSTPATPAPDPALSEEDQRVVDALAAIHPAGRSATIVNRESVGTHLSFVHYTYVPATGMKQDVWALVYDDGGVTHVFKGE